VDALLDNAIRFSRTGGTVHVRAESSKACSVLTIADSGHGIDPTVLPRLFEEFAIADIDHHQSGHGLSLATARLIVEQHGGTLRLVPPEDSTGATFRLELPSAAVPAVAVGS
jgi:signal transduction histidine kinase